MKALRNESGITVKQLKDLIKNLPEVDENTGEDYEVWINGTDCKYGLSNACKLITTLNKGDLIFEI